MRYAVFATVACGAMFSCIGAGLGGGLSVREQSTSAQGSSFAGAAAGYDLSSMFWNPAALGIAGRGFTAESHAALIIPDAQLSGTAIGIGPPPIAGLAVPGASSTDIGIVALVPASYGAYRINKDLVLGLSINAPLGLATKPDDLDWQGRAVGRTSRVFSLNAAPTLSYQIAPGLTVGAGVQLEYLNLLFRFATASGGLAAANPPVGSPNATIDAEDNVGVGFTAGILWQPSAATSIGLGIRSSIAHELEGDLRSGAIGASVPVTLDVDTPEIVTFSFRQAVAPQTRLLGTFEWTNWSRLDNVTIAGSKQISPNNIPADFVLRANWHDSWLLSVGLEYDVNQKLTVRSGLGFEKSPIQNASERLIQVPDSDRWWASVGLTYAMSPTMAFDFAYTHIFFDDAPFVRENLQGTIQITGEGNQSADIVAGSFKIKW